MKTLSDKQLRAVHFLAAGKLGKEVAESVQVTPETVSAWRKLPEFQAYLNRLRNEAYMTARDVLLQQSAVAANGLVKLITEGTSEETRRKAAVNVLTLMGHDNPLNFSAQFGHEDADEIREIQETKAKRNRLKLLQRREST